MKQFRIPEVLLGCFLSVAIFAIGTVTQLFPPADSTRPYQSHQTEVANNKGNAAKTASQDSTYNGSNHDKQESKSEFWSTKLSDWILIGLTFFLAAFTGLLWYSTNKLWKAGERQINVVAGGIRQQSSDTQDAIYQTAISNETAKDTAERQLRAYVNLTEGSVTPNTIHEAGVLLRQLKVGMNFKNGGTTPAYDLRWQVHAQIQRIDAVDPFNFLNDIPFNAGGIIGPGSTITTVQTVTASDEEWDSIRQRQSAIYVGARIEYRDAFGKSRYVVARCISREQDTKSGVFRLGPVADGSEAN